MNAMPWAAIVLGAGQGTRMGAPKVLLRLEGRALVRMHVERLTQAGCVQVIVMVPDGLAGCVQTLLPPQSTASVVIRAVATASPAESLRLGWETLLQQGVPPHLLVTPVDMLPPPPPTLHALLHALSTGDAATPRMGGKSGHPVALRRRVLQRAYGLAAASPAAAAAPSLRQIIETYGSRVQIDADDSTVLSRFNAPGDLQMLGCSYDFIAPETH